MNYFRNGFSSPKTVLGSRRIFFFIRDLYCLPPCQLVVVVTVFLLQCKTQDIRTVLFFQIFGQRLILLLFWMLSSKRLLTNSRRWFFFMNSWAHDLNRMGKTPTQRNGINSGFVKRIGNLIVQFQSEIRNGVVDTSAIFLMNFWTFILKEVTIVTVGLGIELAVLTL